MDESSQIELYKKLLLKEVSSFCRRDRVPKDVPEEFFNDEMAGIPRREVHAVGKSIHATIDEIKKRKWSAAFFGGMLRSLLVSKLDPGISRRPRDIDIVIRGAGIVDLEEVFRASVSRKTRFGGLQLRRVEWQFDVWPLEETQAFLEDSVKSPSFENLPWTTFFNVEAVAVDVWPRPGLARKVYSGDDQFFRGIIHRTLEINRERNPYPELCVVRGLVMAANLRWKVGPRLLSYLARHGREMSSEDFEVIQQKHYGRIQCAGAVFRDAMKVVAATQASALNDNPVELPLPAQLTLWPEDDVYRQRIHLRAIKATKKRPKH